MTVVRTSSCLRWCALGLVVVAACDRDVARAVELGELRSPSPEIAVADRVVAQDLPAAEPAFSGLVLDHATLTLAGVRMNASGTVDVRTGALDVVARAATWPLGGVVVTNIVATIRGDGRHARACVTGRVDATTFTACGAVPPSLSALQHLDRLGALDVAWQIAGPGWRGHGTAAIARGGEVHGHADLVATTLPIGHATLEQATIAADLDGTLADLAVDLTGLAHASAFTWHEGAVTTTIHDVALPFELAIAAPDGVAEARAIASLVATGHDATLAIKGATIAVTNPKFALASIGDVIVWPRSMHWTADEARWHDVRIASPSGTIGAVDTIAWTSITGIGPFDAGAGEVELAPMTGGVRVTRGRVAIAGGSATVEPFDAVGGHAPEMAVHVDGVALDRVLATLGRGRVDGTGALDGRFVVRLDGDASTVVSGTVAARGGGAIRIADAALRAKTAKAAAGNALQLRVAGALADFQYAGLTAELAPEATPQTPELRIALHGRGLHVPQAIDLVINLRGARDAARWVTEEM